MTAPDQATGSRLRHLLDLMEEAVAQADVDVGLVDYRPRFSPYVRALVRLGPSAIRDLAAAVSVTHSAASQTVAVMQRHGLVELRPGGDARQRVVSLTARARRMLPAVDAEWAATAAAARSLDAELPVPLADLVDALDAALSRRSFRARIGDAARSLPDTEIGPFRPALADHR